MKTPYYTTDNRLEGYFVDGQPVPLPPAPTGDDRDDLLVACIDTLSHMGRGRADFWTLDALNEAIDRGHLRTISDLHTAVNEQTEYFDREVTLLRRDKDPVGLEAQVRPWRDRDDLKRRLGVPEVKPVLTPVTPETPEQMAAREVASTAKFFEDRAQRKVDAVVRIVALDEVPRDAADIEREAHRLERIGRGCETHDLTVAKLTNIEAHLRRDYTKRLRPTITTLAQHVRWTAKDLAAAFLAEKKKVESDQREVAEMLAEEIDMPDVDIVAAQNVLDEFFGSGTAKKIEACQLPEPVGVRHLFASSVAVVEFYSTFNWTDTSELVLRLGLDGKYAVDVQEWKEEATNEKPESDR